MKPVLKHAVLTEGTERRPLSQESLYKSKVEVNHSRARLVMSMLVVFNMFLSGLAIISAVKGTRHLKTQKLLQCWNE